MTDDRFDSWPDKTTQIVSSGFVEPKKLKSCSNCFRGLNVLVIGAARYAYACDCLSGQYYSSSGIKTKMDVHLMAKDLMKEQLEIWNQWIKKQ